MFGLLPINKPVGLTSRDAVNRVQRLVRPHKVGHAGTLDPIAQGVLVLCLGPATRLIGYVQQMPKTYRATFQLGCRSASDDIETELEPLADAPQPAAAALEQALEQFRGVIRQRPPAFSAVKIGGRRAYKLARQGEPPEMPEREVEIYRLAIAQYAYPRLELEVECGSGTYIRSLGRDLAAAVGTGAVMTALTRTAIGRFTLDESVALPGLTLDTLRQAIQPATRAVAHLPRRVLTAAEQEEIANGRFIEELSGEPPGPVAGVDAEGRLLAILGPRGGGRIGTVTNFIARN